MDDPRGDLFLSETVSGTVQVNPVWDKLWKLSVPSKVQIFLWKALHGAVPGRAVLAARHIKAVSQQEGNNLE